MNIVITGGSGFVGKFIAEQLLRQGHTIINIDLYEWFPAHHVKNYKFIKKSITDPTISIDIPRNCILIHLAAIQYATLSKRLTLSEVSKKMYEANIRGTLNVIEAAKKAKIKRIIFVSTDMVYGRFNIIPITEEIEVFPRGPYSFSKIIAEKIISKSGIPYLILRTRFIIGPERGGVLIPLFFTIKHSLPVPLLNSGRNVYQMISVYDIAILISELIDKEVKSGVYNVGSEKYSSLFSHFNKLIKEFNSKSFILPIPSYPVKFLFRILCFIGYPILYPEQYEIADKEFVVSIEKIKKATGWKPLYSDYDMIKLAYKKYLKGE